MTNRILMLFVLIGCGSEVTEAPSDHSPTFAPSATGQAYEAPAPTTAQSEPSPPAQPPPGPQLPPQPVAGMGGLPQPPVPPQDAGQPDTSAPAICVVPEDTMWDCQRQECQDGMLVSVVDDTDMQPWDQSHPRWEDLHQVSNSRCNMVGCLDGEPNRVMSRPDGGYNDGTGVCYRCMNGATFIQACP